MTRFFTIFLAAFGAFILFSSDAPGQDERPNILLIMADDMGWSDLGCYGAEIDTPNLDGLAANGLRWSRFYNNARCSPSRASLLTGCYPHKVGVGHLDGNQGQPGYRGFIDPQAVTIAEALQPAGYRTFMTGKWHVGQGSGKEPHDRGFDNWYGCLQGGIYWYPSQAINRKIERDGVEDEPTDPNWFSTDAFTDAAIDYIAQAHEEGKPFFGYIPYIAPHFPLQAKPEDIAKYADIYTGGWDVTAQARYQKMLELGIVPEDLEQPGAIGGWDRLSEEEKALAAKKMAIYAAMVDNMDQNIGRLVTALEQLGILENTLILFLSDNGAEASGGTLGFDRLGTDDLGGPASFSSYGSKWASVSNTPFRGSKKSIWEGGIRTPLIMHWPAGLGTDSRVIDEVGHIHDLMPTLLSIADAEAPSEREGKPTLELDGIDLSPLLKSEPVAERILKWEHEGHRGIRQNQWKLVGRQDHMELYDILADPLETSPVDNPDLERELQQQWQSWAEQTHVFPKP